MTSVAENSAPSLPPAPPTRTGRVPGSPAAPCRVLTPPLGAGLVLAPPPVTPSLLSRGFCLGWRGSREAVGIGGVCRVVGEGEMGPLLPLGVGAVLDSHPGSVPWSAVPSPPIRPFLSVQGSLAMLHGGGIGAPFSPLAGDPIAPGSRAVGMWKKPARPLTWGIHRH